MSSYFRMISRQRRENPTFVLQLNGKCWQVRCGWWTRLVIGQLCCYSLRINEWIRLNGPGNDSGGDTHHRRRNGFCLFHLSFGPHPSSDKSPSKRKRNFMATTFFFSRKQG